MAGHSHAHNIKHKKNATDAKRAKIFTKICREITSTAKQFGPDSARLKVVLDQARKNNLPKENIDRALKKALDPNSADNMEDIVYEGFAFAGIAFMIEACTDNRNRTSSKIREILRKFDGDLGSCSYLFDHTGIINCQNNQTNTNIDSILSQALDMGVTDIIEEAENDSFSILYKPNLFPALQELCLDYMLDSSIIYDAYEKISLNTFSSDQQSKYDKLINLLESADDVEEVYSNVLDDRS